VLAIVIVFSLCTALGFFGSFWWVFDLFSHFRVQYAIGLAVGLVAAAVLRRWGIVLLAVQILVLDVMFLVPAWLPAASPPADAPRVKLLLVNVHLSNRAFGRTIELIRREDPDLVVLLEIDAAWIDAVSPILASHPHRKLVPREDNFGIGVWSRHPLREARVEDFGDLDVPTIVANVDVSGTTVTLVATHPPPPATGRGAAHRDEHLRELGESRAAWDDRVIVAGDLNASPWSAAFRRFTGDAHLLDSRRGFGLQPTWPVGNPLLATPLDHVLYSRGLAVVSRSVGPDVGSDHYPVIAELAVVPIAGE
jgi:endonuclease/exonuclease/phosphatase (EEP) superfamily protein YafD